MKPVLIDTGCIVALLDRSERHHARCVEVVTHLTCPLVTCEAVIAESCYLLRRAGLPRPFWTTSNDAFFRFHFDWTKVPSTYAS